ncbi:hypothetical protein BXZ70DRAFT_922154 [Cristinia sonorae]|uniref:Uncharacterized protein n=1 Tax=Cristinia sonorae TaxID=1940300 RepID=A0A8K0XTK4_9AGAR|nr:hypothetical protein BXZ70DRAFT_922154 [Cristinia sonorae]
MSSARRNDLAEQGRPITDDTEVFKKPFQTVDKPAVTSDNINDQYYRDPPNNQPIGSTTGRTSWGPKEGAFEEIDPKQEGVLGDQAIGKQTKETALAETVSENTVHGGRF